MLVYRGFYFVILGCHDRVNVVDDLLEGLLH